MVPIYATDSWLSLLLPAYSLLFDLMRDCYEAYCIFCFFGLMVTFVQSTQQQDVGVLLETKPRLAHPMPLCFLPRIKLGRRFLRHCYQYILQFVFIKPVLSLTSVILYYYDTKAYNEEVLFEANNGYLWLTLIENISITISLYYLVLYYMATKEELKPFKPVGKFLCIKAIIFFSFWQGVIINLLSTLNIINQYSGMSEGNVGRVLQDFAICIEMFILSIAHHKVFSYKLFRDPNKVPFLWDPKRKRLFVNPKTSMRPLVSNFIQVASVSDVIKDTRKSFLVPLDVSAEIAPVVVLSESINTEIVDEYEPLLSASAP